ncbi:hypothetical protein [Acinetobacter guerrae]|uniref:hypothetical protein n=1 Tax=Acinetobacter guerrae TaxID=1843371 RepID=UPI00128CFAE7|nr:hypothetical protein [Acinetobacter guerrae]MPW43383.1 hypothetical protein [Acinetobacter guerrae]
MSNAFQRFLDLIPKESEFVGTVQAVDHPNYKVLVIDGTGLVACTSSATWSIGSKVFVRGQTIVRAAPNGEVMQIEV